MARLNKKAISAIVAYALLIGISIAMAGTVYVWMKFYVANPLPSGSCPSDVSIIISEANCSASGKQINITVQNRGTFNISGYIIKMNNDSADTSGIVGKYPLCVAGASLCNGIVAFDNPLPPSNFNMTIFSHDFALHHNFDAVQIEPYRILPKGKLNQTFYCDKAIITQKVDCS